MTGTAMEHLGEDTELAPSGETAVTAAAAQARAAVQARYQMALFRPRNIDTVRVRLMQAAKRPGFASTARYAKPVGNGRVVGASIRFAEEAGRALGNLLVETPTLFDDETRRVVRVTVTDLESNLSYSADIALQKVVERKSLRRGQVAISSRTNSQGEVTYLVEATEDEILTKQQAAISKHIRNGILRILPADILEEAMEQVVATLRDEDAKDPTTARKKLVDAFFSQGVGPDQIFEYLGHPLDQMTQPELLELRTVYAALKDGEARWVEIMEAKHGEGAATAKSARGTSGLKERVAKKVQQTDAEKPAPSSTDAASFAQVPDALQPTDEDLELDRQLAAEEGDAP
jgi:hypothetical protein